MTEPMRAEIKSVFDGYDDELRAQLLWCRDLVFEVAASHSEIGPLTETLKWGQPSYLTQASGSGSTLRIAPFGQPAGLATPALYVHCGTDLIEQFRTVYPDSLNYQGKRAVLIDDLALSHVPELRHCIGLVLTYKLRKRGGKGSLTLPLSTSRLEKTP